MLYIASGSIWDKEIFLYKQGKPSLWSIQCFSLMKICMILFLLYHKDVWIDIWKWNYLEVTILLNILKKVILASGKHRTILNKYPKIRKGVISFSPREKTRRNFFCPRSFLRIFLLTEIVVSYSLNEKIWISNVFSSQVLLIITFQYYRDKLFIKLDYS